MSILSKIEEDAKAFETKLKDLFEEYAHLPGHHVTKAINATVENHVPVPIEQEPVTSPTKPEPDAAS